jgi:acyl-CoA reductase-like NAD-dependent aldehyde dehydrogenase
MVDSDREAAELANESDFGLSASIFTSDEEKGKNLARTLECGTVFINDTATSDSRVPNGGIKDSGYGRENYKDGFFETLNRKSIVIPT